MFAETKLTSRLLRVLALVLVIPLGILSILGSGPRPNYAPDVQACAGPNQNVKTGSVVRLDASCSELSKYASADAFLIVNWFLQPPPGSAAALSDYNVINPFFTADVDGEYKLELTASTTTSSRSENSFVYITATSGNTAPVAHAGYAKHVKAGSDVALDGSRSSDADGDLIGYAWTLREPIGFGITLTDADTATPVFDTPVSNVYWFDLQVNDGSEDSPSDHVQVDVTNESMNACPDADAGPNQRVTTGTLVTLDGSGSRDADQDSITLNWRINWRPEGSIAVLDDPIDNETPTFTADVNGAYLIKLAADDAETFSGNVANCIDQRLDVRDTVVVIATSGNSGPVANAGTDQVVEPGNTVQLNGAGSSDADGDSLAYLWSFVSLPQSSTTALSDAAAANPTFVADVAGSYVLKLSVSDGFVNDSDTLVVNASTGSIGQNQPVADAGTDQTVAQGATVMLDGMGSSDPDNDPLTYRWDFQDWPGFPAGIPPTLTGADTATPSFVAADVGIYVLRLIVNDGFQDSVGDTVQITAQVGGTCPNPLNLVTALPFAPGVGEVATTIQIDGDDLSVVAGGAPLGIDVMQANIPDGNNPDQADFVVIGSDWEEISRTHTNPISDSDSPSFVVRQTVDNIYYKFDVEFTGDAGLLEVQIDELTGCRCGNDPGDCPP